jgi:hypothetical protein
VERLDAAVADGRPGDAAELFMTAAVGLPAEAVGGIRQSEFWPIMEAVAPTIAYDGRIMGTTMSGAPLPHDRWAAVIAPTLVMHGTGTYNHGRSGARRAAADRDPAGSRRGRAAQSPAGVLAAALRDFAHAH